MQNKTTQPIKAAVVTVSDKASWGEREDASGPVLRKLLEDMGATVIGLFVVPDEKQEIAELLCHLADEERVDIVLTTGGTGLAPRDWTPEATLAVADRVAPGFAEAMRLASLNITPMAMLSRATSVVRKSTLIINMPGSPKACEEQFSVIRSALPHAVETLRGEAFECAARRAHQGAGQEPRSGLVSPRLE